MVIDCRPPRCYLWRAPTGMHAGRAVGKAHLMMMTTEYNARMTVLAGYRQRRGIGKRPIDAMCFTADCHARAAVSALINNDSLRATVQAICSQVAEDYADAITQRALRSPYWYTGKITKPVPPEVIDHCLSCGARWEDHDAVLRLHAFRSSL